MNLDECIEHYEDTGHGEFKCYENNTTIRLKITWNHPFEPRMLFTREDVATGTYQNIDFFLSEEWQID